MKPMRTARARTASLDMAGTASLMCLMSLFVIMSVGMASMGVLFTKEGVVKRSVAVDEAYLNAEAGVDLALCELRNNTDYGTDGIGVVSGTAGHGTFATVLVPRFAGPGNYALTATGRVDGVTRIIDVEVTQQVTYTGFVGKNSISMSGGIIDTYNSTLGTYLSQVSGGHAGSDAAVKSNGNIGLSGSALIYGDATPGPTGTVTGAAGVTGSTAPASSSLTMPTYTYAPPIASMGSFSGTKVFAPGTYRYSTFTVSGGKTATFTGNVVLYVDGNFSISGSGVGIIAPGAHLTIHQGSGTFTISGSGMVNQDQRPSNLQINSATSSTVTVSGSAAFFGSMLAPNAPLTASGGAGIYGSVQVKSMTLSGGMNLHFDKALGQVGEFHVSLAIPRGRTAGRS